MEDAEFNEKDVRQYYNFLDHKNETQVFAVLSSIPNSARSVFVHSEDEFVEACRAFNGKLNVYAGINERGKDGTENKDVKTVQNILIDVDANHPNKKGSDATPATEEEVAKAVEKLDEIIANLEEKFGSIKHLKLMSGNGAQAILKVPALQLQGDDWEALNEQCSQFQRDIIKQFSDSTAIIDNVGDLRRISKIPGTMSVKGIEVPEEGRVHRLSYFIDETDGEPNAELQKHVLALEVKPRAVEAGEATATGGEAQDIINNILSSNPDIKELIEGWKEVDDDRSKHDTHLAILMLEKGIAEKYIRAILLHRPNSKAATKADPEDYMGRILGYAHGAIREEGEEEFTIEKIAEKFTAEMEKNKTKSENLIEPPVTGQDLKEAIDKIPGKVQGALYPLRNSQKYDYLVAVNEEGARIFSKWLEKKKDYDGKVVKDAEGKEIWVEQVKDLGIVIKKPINIQELWSIDENLYWRIEGFPHLNTKTDILKLLDKDNRIRQGREVKDVLSTVLGERSPPCQTGYPTYGIYEKEDGTLEAAMSPLTPKPSQRRIHDSLDFYTREFTKEELQDYIDIEKYFHPYEILPATGLALAAPFALILRTAGIHVPHLWHWNPKSDLGKTLIMWIMSRRLFGIPFDVQGSNLNTPNNYKLLLPVDSIGNLLTVEEAAFIHMVLFQDLKAFSNNRIAGERGMREGGGAATLYLARAILGFTTNVPPPGEPTTLKRILVVRFDETQRRERRAKSTELDKIYGRLQPIGCGIINLALKTFKQRPLEEWLDVIYDFKEKIAAAYDHWQSVERPEMWAVVYFGLTLRELACKEKGVDWKTPDIETFVKQVVMPIESSTWELKQEHLEIYMDALSRWKAKNTMRVLVHKITEDVEVYGQVFEAEKDRDAYQEETKGSGELWLAKVEDHNDKRIPGVYHSKAMLDEINKTMQIPVEAQMRVLRELGVQVAADFDLPIEFIAGSDGRGRRVRFRKGQAPRRAIFIPYAQ